MRMDNITMPNEMHVPGTKKGIKKGWAWVLGGVAIGGGWLIYNRHKANAASTATGTTTGTTDTTGIDPATGIPYSQEIGANAGMSSGIDPATGVPYADEYGGGGYGGGYGGYGGGVYGSPYGVGSGTTTTTQTVTTNAEWAQASEAYLTSVGYNELTVAVALGKYLSNQGLTADQLSIVQAAIGFEGTPPQGAPTPHLSGGGGGGGQKKTVKTVLAPGNLDCQNMARAHQMTEKQLIGLNPNLAPLVGSKKPIRKGTKVRIYA
jgi:hypothetical protein